jgi:hypothetical protein
MRRSAIFVAAIPELLGASAAIAQPIPAGRKIDLVTYLRGSYGGIKTSLTQAAERMPEGDYGFKPGAAPEMRTFGQVVAHVADAQFMMCAAIRGVPNPNQGKDLEHGLTTKAELTKVLAESFAFCDEALATLTETTAVEFVKQGPGEVAKSGVVVGLVAHGAEMFGISTVYLRAKGLVPPGSDRPPAPGRGARGGV